MYCRKCGSKVEDGARFCAACGAPVTDGVENKEGAPTPQPTDAAAEVDLDDLAPTDAAATDGPDAKPKASSMPTAAQGAVPTPESQANAASAKPKRSKKPLAIAALVVALAAAGGGAGYYFGIYQPEQARRAAQEEALAAKHAVRFSVSAEGWDTSAGASRLPLHITGKEERGKKVDTVAYVDSKGDGVKLRRGKYKAEVAASPIAADGTVYAVPGDGLDLKLSEKVAQKKKAADSGSVKLDQVAATDVTDNEISAAKKYAEQDKDAKKAGFNIDAETLAQAATKRRDDAVAAKQAEEEAKRQAEEEAKKAAEAKQARTIDTDDFTMVLPDWFPISEYEITKRTQKNEPDIKVTKKGSDPEATSFSISIYDADKWGGAGATANSFFKNAGVNSKNRVVLLFGGNGGDPTRPFGMSMSDYGDALKACVTLK